MAQPGQNMSVTGGQRSRQVSDEELARRVAAGDGDAYEQLHLRYEPRLRRFCLRRLGGPTDAEDAVQETLLRVSRALARGQVPASFRPWIHTIAANEASRLQSRRDQAVPVAEFSADQAADEPTPADEAEHADRRALLLAAAEGLRPADHRLVLLLLDSREGDGSTTRVGARRLQQVGRDLLDAIGTLLVARQASRTCGRFEVLTGDHWDGRLTPQLRRPFLEYQRTCATCSALRARIPRPELILGLVPALLVGRSAWGAGRRAALAGALVAVLGALAILMVPPGRSRWFQAGPRRRARHRPSGARCHGCRSPRRPQRGPLGRPRQRPTRRSTRTPTLRSTRTPTPLRFLTPVRRSTRTRGPLW